MRSDKYELQYFESNKAKAIRMGSSQYWYGHWVDLRSLFCGGTHTTISLLGSWTFIIWNHFDVILCSTRESDTGEIGLYMSYRIDKSEILKENLRIGFIGAGRAANVIATALSDCGYTISSISSRKASSATSLSEHILNCAPSSNIQDTATECHIIFVTTPDDVIPLVAKSILWKSGCIVLHCSGSKTLEVLKPARDQGAAIGSLHPIQTFSGEIGNKESLKGVTFAIDGEDDVLDILRVLVSDLGGFPVIIAPELRPLYHISAFLACGGLVTLLSKASSLWECMGYDDSTGLQSLLPLIKKTIENVESKGIYQSMTGPVIRGDIGTIAEHIESINKQSPDTMYIYKSLSKYAAKLSSENGGIDYNTSQQIIDLIENG